MHKINYIQTNIQHICNIGPWYSEKTKERRTTGRNPQGICYWGYLILGVIGKPFLWHDFLKNWELEGLLGVSSSTIFKGKGYIQLETEDDIDKVYEPGVYAIKGTSYNDQTLLVFSHNLGQSTVQFRTNNYGGFLVFRIKWWNGGWGTWKTVSLT